MQFEIKKRKVHDVIPETPVFYKKKNVLISFSIDINESSNIVMINPYNVIQKIPVFL